VKLIVAGSRSFEEDVIDTKGLIKSFLDRLIVEENISEIVSGMAQGPDLLGREYAIENNIPVKEFPADWSKGRGAGYIRNAEMGDYADSLIVFWNGISSGTEHMVRYMQERNKPVIEVNYGKYIRRF
jgi:hypothetical protein